MPAARQTKRFDMLPQTDAVKDKGYEILYLTENVDEFALKCWRNTTVKSL